MFDDSTLILHLNQTAILACLLSLLIVASQYNRATQTFTQTIAQDEAVMAINRGANSRSDARMHHASTQSISCAYFVADHSNIMPIK